MHKSAIPPLINKTENVSSLQVNGLMIGGIPSWDWGVKYNNGVGMNVSGAVIPDPINPLLSINDNAPVYIDYLEQPFNYIEMFTTNTIIRPLAINFISATWIYVYANSIVDLIISPQTPYSSTFDSNNNYTLPAGSLSLVHIKPSVTSVLRSRGEAEDQISFTTIQNDQITVSSIQLT